MVYNAARARNLAGLGLAWLTRRTCVPAPPVQIFIETTNDCNYRCSYCVYKLPEYQGLPKKKMGTAEFRLIMERIHRAAPSAAITLALGGEPFLHEDLVELIRICNEHGYGAGIASNGSLLTEDRSRELVASRTRYGLLVDFCADPVAYEGHRRQGSWELVRRNLTTYLALCRQSGRRAALGIKDMGPAARSDLSAVGRRSSLDRLRALFPELPESGFMSMSPHNWTGQFGSPPKSRYTLCTHPYSSMAINSSGDVVACCRDLLYQYRVGSLLSEVSLMDLWNGPRMKALRDGLRRRDFARIPLCKECDHPYQAGRFLSWPLMRKLRAAAGLLRRR